MPQALLTRFRSRFQAVIVYGLPVKAVAFEKPSITNDTLSPALNDAVVGMLTEPVPGVIVSVVVTPPAVTIAEVAVVVPGKPAKEILVPDSPLGTVNESV